MLSKFSLEKKFIFGLLIYFILQIGFRIIISDSLEHDEAEMVLLSQQAFQLGYNSQPPLYTWLQLILFNIFGLNIFSLTLLKYGLMFIMYFFIYKAALRLIKNQLYAIFSAISLFLAYDFAWSFHKDLTHSILAVTIAAMTFYLFLRLVEEDRLKYYVLLGLAIGLGVLSKYNYLVFIIALLISGLMIKDLRGYILNRYMLVSGAIVLVIIVPHFYWGITHKDDLLIDTYKFKVATKINSQFFLKSFGLWFSQVLAAIASLPFFYFLFFPQGFSRLAKQSKKEEAFKQLLERYFYLVLIILLILIVGFKVTKIKSRWITPLFFLLPTYFFLRIKDLKIQLQRIKAFMIFISVIIIGLLVWLPARLLVGQFSKKYSRTNLPYSQVAKEIKDSGFDKGLIVTQYLIAGGDLKLQFKDSLVITAQRKIPYSYRQDFTKLLVIWKGQGLEYFSEELKDILARHNLNPNLNLAVTKKVLYKYSQDKEYVFSFIIDEIK